MKTKILSLITIISAFVSCTKDEPSNPEPLLASISVVNAAVDQSSILVNKYGTTIDYSKLSTDIYFQSSANTAIPSGKLPFEVVSGDGTDDVLYQDNLDFKPSKIYSLFIAGNSAKRENFIFEETTIPRYKDSIAGVRVINLSQDGPAFNLTAINTPDKVEFSNVTYGKKTDFMPFQINAQAVQTGIGFEIRDAQTDEVLTTYYLSEFGFPLSTSSVRFKAMTLVVCGSLGAEPFSSGYYTVFAVPNY